VTITAVGFDLDETLAVPTRERTAILADATADVDAPPLSREAYLDVHSRHLTSDSRTPIFEELLSEFSITHLRAAPAVSLSGGERRRAEIARCLASNPRYLLLDEPFAGVDPIAVSEIRALVADLRQRGLGVLITDHNVRETLEIVDRAYILHDGTVLMSGTAEEVVQDENVRRVYLGQSFRIG